MRSVLRAKNRELKYFIFVLLFCLLPTLILPSYAYTTVEEKLERQENWSEIYGGPPRWCPPAENPDLAVICGRAVSGKQMLHETGNYLPNVPLENVTVEVWEQNPISPTGKLIGNLTHVVSSSITNSDGRFQVTMRKVGPPNKVVYLVFKCGDEAQKPKQLDSWHDYWGLNFQVACITEKDEVYEKPTPPFPLVASRAGFLGCEYDARTAVVTGMEKMEQPTVNNIVESENFDHRHTQNTFSVDIGVNLPAPFSIPNLNFSTSGGWWEADCLQKDRVATYGDAGNGTQYSCGVIDSCDWDGPSWDAEGQLGSDVELCDSGGTMYSTESGNKDRITRPFYFFIPKTLEEEPYRRLDIKGNLKDYSEEPLLPMANTTRLWGSAISDPVGQAHVFLRGYMADDTADTYISCAELQKRNSAVEIVATQQPQKNRYLNGGPLGGLAPESKDWETIYNAVINCDPTVTDRANPAFCTLRDPTDPVCNDYVRGRTEKNGNPIRFCDIQPPFGDTAHCHVGEPGCGGPCGAGLTTEYLYSKSYFGTEMMFATGVTAQSIQSNVFNDSVEQGDTVYRSQEFELFDTETRLQARALTRNIRQEDDQKGNSALTAESILEIEKYVPDTEAFGDPLTSPFTDSRNDYTDLAVWKIYEIGSPQPLCGLGNPYNSNIITGPLEEAVGLLFPDNIFEGNIDTVQNPGQLRHKAISTSTWYMSQDAIDRDAAMRDHWTYVPISVGTNSSIINTALSFMVGRDIFDSVLSMLQGDAKLHNFQISLADIITAINQLSNDSDVKTFGDRHELSSQYLKNYYDVAHPLSEENFAFDPVNTPGGIFVLPPKDPAIDASGYYGNPGTDGEPLMPDDWTDTTQMPASCYPFNSVPEGSICDSFREDPDGVSRTCRLDECKTYYRVETGTCTCAGPYLCVLTNVNEELVAGDCDVLDRLECAQNQETTTRCIPENEPRDQDEPPAEICKPNYPAPLDNIPGSYDNRYDPPPIDPTTCTGTLFDWTSWNPLVEPFKQTDLTGDPGETAERCNVSRAGPMQGGNECNGTLKVGDFALRLEQRPPSSIHNQPYEELDAVRTASLKVDAALLPPFQPLTDGSYLALMDGSNSDKAADITEGTYTYGAEIETAGYGNASETAQYSTTPIEGDRSIPLKELYYHCRMPNYTPILRGEMDYTPYTGYDPDMGSVDDNGDGAFGPGDEGWTCALNTVPDPEWVEYTNTTGNCAISNTSACLAHPAVPDDLPPAFFNTVNMAANLVETPAAILVAVLVEETGLVVPGGYWNDEFKIQMWGRPWYGKIDAGGTADCDDNSWSATGPYAMLQTDFYNYLEFPSVVQTFDDLADGRSRSASRCNFLDASIMAAFYLKQPVGGTVANTDAQLGGPGECGSAYDPAIHLGTYSGGSYNAGQTGNAVSIYAACK